MTADMVLTGIAVIAAFITIAIVMVVERTFFK